MPTRVESGPLASELRVVLGHLIRRLRAEHRFSLSQGSVLGRLDREGAQSTSKLAELERVRPQSMATTLAVVLTVSVAITAPTPDATSTRDSGWASATPLAATSAQATNSLSKCMLGSIARRNFRIREV